MRNRLLLVTERIGGQRVVGKGMRTKAVIAAGLGQVLLLLLAFWPVRQARALKPD